MSLSDEVAAHDPNGELEELRAAANRLARSLARERSRTEALVDAVMTAARDASIVIGKRDLPRAQRDRRKASGEVAIVHTTDWQAGKVTTTFDLDVLERRIAQLADKVERITEIQRAAHPVRKVVVMPGGDMVEGISIFPGQAWEINATLYEQTFRCAAILEAFIARMAETFEEVEVWDIFGNHGRIGRRGENPRLDNIDRLVYAIVAERFNNQPRIVWHHAETWHQHVPIGAYTALLVHGDQIRSFGGNLPAYGILRKVAAWSSGVLPPFTDAWIGHFHTPQILNSSNGRKVVMTGSPESDNEFAKEFVAATGPPSQTLAFIDPEAGRMTAYYDIVLD